MENKMNYIGRKNAKLNLMRESGPVLNMDDYSKITDDVLESYQESISESIIMHNTVDMAMYGIDCLERKKGLSYYESAVLESFVKDTKSTTDYVPMDYNKIVPYITPYLTFDEYTELFPNTDKNPFQYVFNIDEKKYFNEVRSLQKKYTREQDEESRKRLLELGWNPIIEVDGYSIREARRRQSEYLNGNAIRAVEITDVSKFTTDLSDEVLSEVDLQENKLLEPIYIVLSYTNTAFGKIIKRFQNSVYTHAALALDATLNKMYSFNYKIGTDLNGLSIESIDDYHDENGNAKLKILCVFISKAAKKKLQEVLKWFEDHKEKTKYGFSNLFNIVINRSQDVLYNTSMVCSQFVDSVLKMCNIDITHQTSNLVTPKTFEKLDDADTKTAKVFKVFEGWKTKYNPREIKRKVLALTRMTDKNRDKKIVKEGELSSLLFEYKIENFDLYYKGYDTTITETLDTLISAMTPSPMIIGVQEVNFPIRFSKKGDLIIKKKEDLQLEYNEAHKLLSMYDQTNSEGIKHELARLFYLNSIIEKKLKKMKNNTSPEYKELIDLRARILNDFTVYFKTIKTIEKSFDFMEYMKNSEYYNKTIVVDDSTLKYSGSMIKKFLTGIMK